MQFIKISRTTTLKQLRDKVGTDNLEAVLNSNCLSRVPNIGAQVYARQQEARQVTRSSKEVSYQSKVTGLNKATQDSDVFETMALMDNSGWRVYTSTDELPGTVFVPASITLAASENVLGNGQRVDSDTYSKVMKSLQEAPHEVDPQIFSSYATDGATSAVMLDPYSSENLFQFFKIPWGNMSIYSSISGTSKDFPVYPEEMSDGVKANYTTMPEIIYQYEPWQLYTSSGPRSNSYTFIFHRDMWTGDHRDGKANELVRFCMAQCYPEYNGSAVNAPISTLYMNGQVLIRGVLNDVNVNWEGPLGLDNFYLVCKLTLSFIEVSPYPLDYWTVMQKPLIG